MALLKDQREETIEQNCRSARSAHIVKTPQKMARLILIVSGRRNAT
jgi:hypothetical protein